ncbi:tetratricopeptide repeat protein [Secundilactobacillus similis]|uniref:tetratricopeptide repeat protein n=1 Tax=Secundilactobacillus similis TaxID=414682 RepID=UPI0006D0A76B|nr:tetratricopeptide repeat protein [Secundilactobacillus similis]
MTRFYQADFMNLLLKDGLKLTQANVADAFDEGNGTYNQSRISKIKSGSKGFNTDRIDKNYAVKLFDRFSNSSKINYRERYLIFQKQIELKYHIELPMRATSSKEVTKEIFVKTIKYLCQLAREPERANERASRVNSDKKVHFTDSFKVPVNRSALIGRSNELKELDERLANNRVVVLTGLGGIGKTALILNYVSQIQDTNRFKSVQFITYQNSLKQTIVQGIDLSGISPKITDEKREEQIFRFIKNQTNDTLIVIDNMVTSPYSGEDRETFDEITSGRCRFVFLTRAHDEDIKTLEFPILPLSEKKQLQLFSEECQVPYYDAPEDQQKIKQILKTINGHTLTIILIAKYMAANDTTPDAVITTIGEGIQEFNDQNAKVKVATAATNTQQGTIFSIIKNIFNMAALNIGLKRALALLVCLPEQGVPLRKFLKWNQQDITLKERIGELIGLNWIEYSGKTDLLRPHPIIRDVVIDAQQHERFINLENVDDFLTEIEHQLEEPNVAISQAHIFSQMISNAASLLVRDATSVQEIKRFVQIAEDMDDNSTYYEMDSLYKLILQRTGESEMGEMQFRILSKLAHSEKELGKYQEAIAHYQQIIKSFKNIPEPQLASFKCQLGILYRKQGRYQHALDKFQEAIELMKNEPNNLVTAEIYNERGVAYLNQGELDKALVDYEKGRIIREKIGNGKKDLAFSYHNIGTVYQKLGNFELAIRNHQKALQLRTDEPREKEEDVAASLNMLGLDYMHVPDKEEQAENYLKRAFKLRSDLYGEYHPQIAWSCYALGQFYEKCANYEKAYENAYKSLMIRLSAPAGSRNYRYISKSIELVMTIYRESGQDEALIKFSRKFQKTIRERLMTETY